MRCQSASVRECNSPGQDFHLKDEKELHVAVPQQKGSFAKRTSVNRHGSIRVGCKRHVSRNKKYDVAVECLNICDPFQEPAYLYHG